MKIKIITFSKKVFLKLVLIMFLMILILSISYFKLSNIKTDSFNDPHNRVIVIDPGHGGIDGGASIPGVLVETAFLSNKRERELLLGSEFKEDIANSIVIGVEKYLKIDERVSSP